MNTVFLTYIYVITHMNNVGREKGVFHARAGLYVKQSWWV